MGSQNSQINGMKTRPVGKESLRVPGPAGEALRGSGPRGSKYYGTATHAARKLYKWFYPGHLFFLYLEHPTTSRGCLG